MKKYLRMSSTAVVTGTLRVNCLSSYFFMIDRLGGPAVEGQLPVLLLFQHYCCHTELMDKLLLCCCFTSTVNI